MFKNNMREITDSKGTMSVTVYSSTINLRQVMKN